MNRHSMRAALLYSVLFAAPAPVHEVPKPNGDTPRRTELFAPGVLEASGAVTMDIGAPVAVPGLGSYGRRSRRQAARHLGNARGKDFWTPDSERQRK